MLGINKEDKKEDKKVDAAAPAKAAPKGDKPLDMKKVEKDDTNEGTFFEGDEFELKGLKFTVKKVMGLEITLIRKDFK